MRARMQPVVAMSYKVVASCLILGFADLLLGAADARTYIFSSSFHDSSHIFLSLKSASKFAGSQ